MLKKRFFLVLSFLSCIVCIVQVVSASPINIDFGAAYTGGIPNSYGAASGQTGNWNYITNLGTTSGLLNTSGSVTGVELSLSATSIFGGSSFPTNTDGYLLNDNFYADPASSWNLFISNLDQGFYDIYYYAPANSLTSIGVVSVNRTKLQLTRLSGVPDPSSLIQGSSWDVLSNVRVDSSGFLTFNGIDKISLTGLAGLQIVPVSAVPIPAAFWLFGTALIGLVGLSKRRKPV